jgi:hypothetical protein
LVDKPGTFDGSGWREWKLKLEVWLVMVDDRFPLLLQEAAKMASPIAAEVVPPEIRSLGHLLYSVLVTSMSGILFELMSAVRELNGFEAWRVLVQDREEEQRSRGSTSWPG